LHGRQDREAQARCFAPKVEDSVFFGQPYRVARDDDRDHRDIRLTGNLEGSTPEAVQLSLRRARALGEDKYPETLFNAQSAGAHHRARVARATGTGEQARPLQQRLEPATAVEGRLHRRSHVLERRHDAGDVTQAWVIGDQHRGPLGQFALDLPRVEVEQTAHTQRVVHQGEGTSHHTL
jgi:hypothetical protein